SAGDAALKALTKAGSDLAEKAGGAAQAIFARIGGEEFVVLLPGVDADAARTTAEQLRKAIAEIRVAHGKHGFGFTASMGVASVNAEDRSFESALSRADTALYAAKDAGRNCVKVG